MKEHYCVTILLLHGTHTSKKGKTNKTVYNIRKKKKQQQKNKKRTINRIQFSQANIIVLNTLGGRGSKLANVIFPLFS